MPEPTFNDINWHDSSVLKIELDLDLNEDERFEIIFQLIEDYHTLKTSWKRMKLHDCREIRIKGHIGFRGGNSIQSGEIMAGSELFSETYSSWKRMGLEVEEGHWKHYHFLTNTGSEIDIVAAGFVLEDEEEKQQAEQD